MEWTGKLTGSVGVIIFMLNCEIRGHLHREELNHESTNLRFRDFIYIYDKVPLISLNCHSHSIFPLIILLKLHLKYSRPLIWTADQCLSFYIFSETTLLSKFTFTGVYDHYICDFSFTSLV